ncbi:plasmid pRiA4b ORF-3 family protein [Bacillus sp. FJAT-27225]|uniref:plasmid pRiA4b ORF-3 family protein n=1 Tax=Bacillus sp. FJAT-27225 TaxID=1743144 RepID=UPI003F8AD30F
MYKDLEEFAGEPVFGMDAAQLKIVLALEEHRVWRRVVVPLNRTFEGLHEIIQAAFGWQDSHLHEFNLYDQAAAKNVLSGKAFNVHPFLKLVCTEEAFSYAVAGIELKHEEGVGLTNYLPECKVFTYVYDLGDDWQHVIEVEKVIEEYDKPYPICLEGDGNTQPEDVGGEGGYAEFLRILADPSDPEHEHMAEWGRMQKYREFDLDEVNRKLKRAGV